MRNVLILILVCVVAFGGNTIEINCHDPLSLSFSPVNLIYDTDDSSDSFYRSKLLIAFCNASGMFLEARESSRPMRSLALGSLEDLANQYGYFEPIDSASGYASIHFNREMTGLFIRGRQNYFSFQKLEIGSFLSCPTDFGTIKIGKSGSVFLLNICGRNCVSKLRKKVLVTRFSDTHVRLRFMDIPKAQF